MIPLDAERKILGLDSNDVRQMDSVKYKPELRKAGATVGKQQINVKKHFINFL